MDIGGCLRREQAVHSASCDYGGRPYPAELRVSEACIGMQTPSVCVSRERQSDTQLNQGGRRGLNNAGCADSNEGRRSSRGFARVVRWLGNDAAPKQSTDSRRSRVISKDTRTSAEERKRAQGYVGETPWLDFARRKTPARSNNGGDERC
jgi:hypothetical protein